MFEWFSAEAPSYHSRKSTLQEHGIKFDVQFEMSQVRSYNANIDQLPSTFLIICAHKLYLVDM